MIKERFPPLKLCKDYTEFQQLTLSFSSLSLSKCLSISLKSNAYWPFTTNLKQTNEEKENDY